MTFIIDPLIELKLKQPYGLKPFPLCDNNVYFILHKCMDGAHSNILVPSIGYAQGLNAPCRAPTEAPTAGI